MGSCFSCNHKARKELDFAISQGHSPQAITECLLRVDNINAVLPISKLTALELAVHKERSSIVKQVLDRQPSTEPTCNEGWTPLIRASNQGCLDIVKSLLQCGANITARTRDGASCLLLAVKNKHLSVVSYLLEQQLCPHDDIEADGFTSLHHVILLNDPESTLKLLGKGVDINAKTKEGETAIFLATKHNCTDSLKVLLEPGADPNICAKNGVSPLLEAVKQNNIKAVGLLAMFGALAGQELEDDWSMLVVACSTGSLETVTKLVDNGAKVDVRTQHEHNVSSSNDADDHGYTLLHHVALFNDRLATSTLISNGLDIDAKTQKGETSVFLATKHSCLASLEVLLDSGADPNIRTTNGDSALKEAVTQGSVETVLILLAHGADASICRNRGQSPINLALEVAVARILKNNPQPSVLQFVNQKNKPSVLEKVSNTVELASNVMGLYNEVFGE